MIGRSKCMRLLAAALLVLGLNAPLALAAPTRHGPARAGAPAHDWTRTVTIAPGGGHLIGNPNAKVKLVEFISYTCTHCAHFNEVTQAPLRGQYVRTGQVSVEIRSLVRDPIDLTAAMLVTCGEPARFAGNHDLFLGSQERWFAALDKSSDEQRKRWDTGALPVRLRAIAADFGFYPMMAARGYSRGQVDACLSDKSRLDRLIAQTDGAAKLGANSTPSFLVNGTLVAVHDWPSLEPMIKAAL